MDIFVNDNAQKRILISRLSTSRVELMMLQLVGMWMVLSIQLVARCIAGSSDVTDWLN